MIIIAVPEYEDENLWRGLLDSYRKYPDKLYLQYGPSSKDNPSFFRFALASYLLWARPNSHVALHGRPSGPPLDPLLDIQMGSPLGETQPATQDVYTREYGNGRVYLNISPTSSEWVQIPPGLVNADTKQPVPEGARLLGPHEPLILLQQA